LDVLEFDRDVANPHHLLQSFNDIIYIMTNIENNNIGVYIESINGLATNVNNFENINNIEIDATNSTVEHVPQQNPNTTSKVTTIITSSLVVIVAIGFCYFFPNLTSTVLGVGAQMVPPVPS
jgi:hypothetical protein